MIARREGADPGEHQRALVVQDLAALGRDPGGDRAEDQQRHAVADAALGDQLAEPHDDRGAGGHHDHDDRGGVEALVRDDLLLTAREQLPALGQRDDAGGLQHGERDRQVPGVLGQLALAGLAFLLELLEARDDHGQQLDDDAGRDVGHDAQREDRQLQQRTAAEQVDQVVDALVRAAGGGIDAGLDVRVGDAGGGDGGAEPVDGDDPEREEDLLAKVRGRQGRPERAEHSLIPPGQAPWVGADTVATLTRRPPTPGRPSWLTAP